MHHYYLLLGSNLEPRKKLILRAVKKLVFLGEVVGESSFYESESWGFISNKFLNKLLVMVSKKKPLEMLNATQCIEKKLGRERDDGKYIARKIDIDILFIDNLVVNTKKLMVPHPKLHLRRFALLPLLEINKNKFHPIFGKKIKELLAECQDKLQVKKL